MSGGENDTQVNIALLKKEDEYHQKQLDRIEITVNKIAECIDGNGKPGIKTEFGVMKNSVKWLTWGFRLVIALIIAVLGYLKIYAP